MGAECFDVLVIGGGPAGARSAELLANAGRRVAICEAGDMTRPKLCGGLLNRRAQAIASGLGGLPADVCINSDYPSLAFPALEYHDLDNRVRARYSPGYRSIDRLAFDRWLVARAKQAGTQVFYQTRAQSITVTKDLIHLETSAGPLTASWLIDASGAASFSRKRLGGPTQLKLHAVQGEVELDPASDAMWAIYRSSYTPLFSWIIPRGGGRFLLGTALKPADAKARRHDSQNSAREHWAMLAPLMDYLEHRGISIKPCTRRPRSARLAWALAQDSLWWGRGSALVAGEAAGLLSPFSGEGISYALDSAEAAAFAVISGAGADALPELLIPLRQKLASASLKARIAMHAWLRPWPLLLMPKLTGQRVEYMRWHDGLEVKPGD
jgi:flavin-dependent dehydrogenase